MKAHLLSQSSSKRSSRTKSSSTSFFCWSVWFLLDRDVFSLACACTAGWAQQRLKMACNYVVTAQPSTAVFSSLTANFTGPNDVNLIAAKGKRLDISLVTSDGLKPVLDLPIYGRIQSVLAFRPKVEWKCDNAQHAEKFIEIIAWKKGDNFFMLLLLAPWWF